MSSAIKSKTTLVRKEAQALGFQDIGFSRAGRLDAHASKLKDWLDAGYNGEMSYMANHFDKRVDPTELVDGARTIISLSYNYFTSQKQEDIDAPVISKYAFGRDYHKVVKKKLLILLDKISDDLGIQNARAFVDSAPVLERAWAHRGGLGWIGKNTMLIHPKRGSYFFLAELVVDVELDYNMPMKDFCGRCRRCIEACPTSAIVPEGYVLKADQCISYATIEKKGPIPDHFRGKMDKRVFGCDICIEVCPWNRFAKEHNEPDFVPGKSLLEMSREDWEGLDEEKFNRLFYGTPVMRTKYEGLKRNLAFIDE
jgi:epoxyqueuosine reductase